MSKFNFNFTQAEKENKKPEKEKEIQKTQIQKQEISLYNINIPQYPNTDINSEADLDNYLEAERTEYKYDPRPDIDIDHNIWVELLQTAENYNNNTNNNKVYNLFHYLRCGGCRLKLERNNNYDPVLKLDLDNSTELLELYLPDGWDKEEEKPEQLALMQIPGSQQMNEQRQRNINLAKKKEKLLPEAKKRLLEEDILPLKKEVFAVFAQMKNVVKAGERDVGKFNFNLVAFNKYLERQKEMKKYGKMQR